MEPHHQVGLYDTRGHEKFFNSFIQASSVILLICRIKSLLGLLKYCSLIQERQILEPSCEFNRTVSEVIRGFVSSFNKMVDFIQCMLNYR